MHTAELQSETSIAEHVAVFKTETIISPSVLVLVYIPRLQFRLYLSSLPFFTSPAPAPSPPPSHVADGCSGAGQVAALLHQGGPAVTHVSSCLKAWEMGMLSLTRSFSLSHTHTHTPNTHSLSNDELDPAYSETNDILICVYFEERRTSAGLAAVEDMGISCVLTFLTNQ